MIGIAGGSGSGKTTLSRSVCEAIGADHSIRIEHDSYYRDLSHLEPPERAAVNFDHPDSLEAELTAEHLRHLKHGASIDVPPEASATM